MQELTADERLQQGKAAVQDGDKQRARELLQPLVEDYPQNAEAWLWLSGAQTSPAEMAACLQRVLEIEPANQDALDTMAWLEAKHGSAGIGTIEPPSKFSEQSFQGSATLSAAYDERATTEADEGIMSDSERQSLAPRRSTARSRAVTPPKSGGSRTYPTSPYAKPIDRRQLLEYGLGVGGVGALVGLLRLAGQLRPGTLLVIRGASGTIAPTGAIVISIATALLHGLALVLAWQILGRTAAAARNDRPGDITDSLGRIAPIFWPGYSLMVGLLLVALSLGAGERRWLAVVALVWIIVLASIVMAARRLVAVYGSFRLRSERQGVLLLRMTLPAVVVGLVGLGLAGLLIQRLLAGI